MADLQRGVSRRAYGKVNLALRVLGRRQDGYHEVSTVMAAVGLCDVLTFSLKQEGLSILCPRLPDLPQEKNLVTKAARSLFAACRDAFGLEISIEKNIPSGAGMGGGSSDAAATLLAVNDIFPQCGRHTVSSLARMAAVLGADVLFFLGCNAVPPAWEAALCTGTGSTVTPLDSKTFASNPLWLVLAFPTFPVNTAQAYRDWDERRQPGTGQEAETALLAALQAGDWEALAKRLFNDLESAVSDRHPGIWNVKRKLLACGALGASMTGSGSAVYGICSSQEHANEVRLKMEEFGTDLGLGAVVVTRAGCER